MKYLTFLFVLLASYFLGCSPPDDLSIKEIRNDSSENLIVRLFFEGDQLDPQIFVPSGEKTPILTDYFFAKSLTDNSPCTSSFDSVAIFIENDKKLKIDLLDETNWTSTLKTNRWSHTQNCTLVVTDADIE